MSVSCPCCIPAIHLATAGTDATALRKQRHKWVTLNGCVCVCVFFTGFSHSLATDLQLKGTRCVSLKIGHMRHHKCLKLTKIASHMSKVSVPLQSVWTGSSSCPVCLWGSDVFPSLPTALTVFHLFGHSEGLEINPPPPPHKKISKKKQTLDTQG